jgi:CheY-like chemotaxis protein
VVEANPSIKMSLDRNLCGDRLMMYAEYMKQIKTLYIIDDDEIMVYLTKNIVSENDFCERCDVFNSGQAALERLREAISNGQDLPDLILVDIHMPVMDGWEFLDELAKLLGSISIPVFIFSSLIDNASKQKMLEYARVMGYIQKPLTIVKLNKILRLIS